MNAKKNMFRNLVSLLIMSLGASAYSASFDSAHDAVVFNLINVSNDLFLKTNQKDFHLFSDNINYSRWNQVIAQMNDYMQKNAVDLRGKKDEVILNTFDTMLQLNNKIMGSLRTTYDNYVQVKNPTRDGYKKGEEIIYQLNMVRKNIEKEKRNSALIKLLNGRTTLPRKKDCIDVITRFAEILEKICTRAVTDYFKISRRGQEVPE